MSCMKKYIATDKVFEGTTNPAKIFTLLTAAGESGLTRDELAAKAVGMAPTGIYTYLYTLVKGRHVRTLETGTPRTATSVPAVEVPKLFQVGQGGDFQEVRNMQSSSEAGTCSEISRFEHQLTSTVS